jgi:putative FmdB family regulatory protein
MPLYEYKCKSCGKIFEKLESFNTESVRKCPECGSPAKRLLSLGSFILKGSGWYATDHPSCTHPKTEPKENGSCGTNCSTCCPADQKTS